ncbi:protein phosphatase 1G-like [Corticium candelabrum]|uniref:protein phosphatase 1G-like n=1 Tax=Corticium candelabrum TaxID=121492 RepID=UPI002E25DF51|nr:protein phosphatase 1G-like [Corticium candelabrum]XP_062506899.1 protein phosphatase 1G-like [Corticium candelabrum]
MKECGFESGSTAVIALLRGRELYVSSAGDSRCVMCCRGETVALSVDHKPEDEKELKRITEVVGMVDHTGRVNRGLNLSRAIGDHLYKQNKQVKLEDQMISALPDVYHKTLSSDHSFMILASDGIWNMMTSEQSVEYVKERLVEDSEGDLSRICEQMIDHCLAPDKTGDGSDCDNMTVVIVQFLHESTEESKSSFVSPTKGKSLGKRPTPSGSEIDSNEQVKRSRLETKPSQ